MKQRKSLTRKKLYPSLEPFRTGRLKTGDGHEVYYEECGTEGAIPALFLHGGPGGGISPVHRRYFNPEKYHIILFDQRGCGKSRPHAETKNNTTQHLLADIRQLKDTLGIDKWLVFGGSWGSTLGLVYAEEDPGDILALVLRGIFLFRKQDMDWFLASGTPKIFPDAHRRWLDYLTEGERDDPVQSYYRRLHSETGKALEKTAKVWSAYEMSTLAIGRAVQDSETLGTRFALAFARIESHYFANRGFLGRDSRILEKAHCLADIPATIVHGRYDAICPPQNAFDLAGAMPHADLQIIEDAGHSAYEPGIQDALIRATDTYAETLKKG